MQRPRGDALKLAPAHQCFLAPVRRPHFGCSGLVDGAGQFVPVAMIRDDQRQLHPALLGTLADAHPAGSKARHRVGKASRPAVGEGRRRSDHDGAGKVALRAALDRRRLQFAETDPLALVIVAELGQRAVHVDRPVVSCIADQPDDTLRLAERVGADQMRACRELLDRCQQLADFMPVGGMPENRKPECRFGDEHIALDGLECLAGGIGLPLVVAGGDNACPALLDRDLRRTEDVAGRVECHRHAVDGLGLAKLCRLGRACEIGAMAQRHDVERLPRRQHRRVAGAGVVRMTMRDQGARDRPHRIDEEIAGRAIETFGAGMKQVAGAHPIKIGPFARQGSLRADVAATSIPAPPGWHDLRDPLLFQIPLGDGLAAR